MPRVVLLEAVEAAMQLSVPDNVHICPFPLCLPILPSLLTSVPLKTVYGVQDSVTDLNAIQFSSIARGNLS